MSVTRSFLALFAVSLGMLITALAVGTIFILGPVFWLICRPFGWRNPIECVPAWWGHAITEACFVGIMGVKIRRSFRMRPIDRDRPVILMCNHPSLLAVPIFMSMAAQAVGPRLVGVGRKELLYVPFVGWPLWIINAAIFITRHKPKKAFDELRRAFPLAAKRGAAVYIFPDKHRPTLSAIARDHAEYATRISGVHTWEYTPVPRKGGLGQLLQTAGSRVTVINMTLGFSAYDGDAFRPDRLVGETFFALASDRLSFSPNPDVLERQLNAEWGRKNAHLRHWRTPSRAS